MNEIFSPSNKIHREVGRAKDLSAPLYKVLFVLRLFDDKGWKMWLSYWVVGWVMWGILWQVRGYHFTVRGWLVKTMNTSQYLVLVGFWVWRKGVDCYVSLLSMTYIKIMWTVISVILIDLLMLIVYSSVSKFNLATKSFCNGKIFDKFLIYET